MKARGYSEMQPGEVTHGTAEMSANHIYTPRQGAHMGGLNVECPPQTHVSERLAPRLVVLFRKIVEPLGGGAFGDRNSGRTRV